MTRNQEDFHLQGSKASTKITMAVKTQGGHSNPIQDTAIGSNGDHEQRNERLPVPTQVPFNCGARKK